MRECRCGLSLEPPADVEHWHPTREAAPRCVAAVVRYGEAPELRRAERAKDGWTEHGAKVNFYLDRTPPMPWVEVGTCWVGVHHPSSMSRGYAAELSYHTVRLELPSLEGVGLFQASYRQACGDPPFQEEAGDLAVSTRLENLTNSGSEGASLV
jgi:hypothetical protein